MSSIHSISSNYSQSISSLYDNASLYKSSGSTASSSTANTYSPYKADNLVLSEEGLSMLQSIMKCNESDTDQNTETETDNRNPDVISQLEDLASSDKLSEEQKSTLTDIIEKLKEALANNASEESGATERPMMPPPPPMGPMNFKYEDTGITAETKETEGTEQTAELADELGNYKFYPMNFNEMVSSGIISQEQANTIMSAFDTVAE